MFFISLCLSIILLFINVFALEAMLGEIKVLLLLFRPG